MKTLTLILLAVLSIAIAGSYVECADINTNAGTSGAEFLKIPVGARASALGGAYTSIGGDVNGICWNPSGLALINNFEISAMHYEWFQGIRYNFVGLSKKLTSRNNLSLGIMNLAVSGIEKRAGATDSPDEIFGANDMAGALSVSHRLNPKLSLGISGKFINSSIYKSSVSGMGFDAGALYKDGSLALGASVLNIGGKLDKDPLPLTIRAGGSLYLMKGDVILSGDVSKVRDRSVELSAGAEGWIGNLIALRLGYNYSMDKKELGNYYGLSAGLGLNVGNIGVDYAFVPFGDRLGSTHRVSLTYRGSKLKLDNEVSDAGKKKTENIKPEKVKASQSQKHLAPIQIVDVKIEDIFSALYKYYLTNSIGKVILKNNTAEDYSNIKVSFKVERYMDMSYDIVIDNMAPGEQKEIEIFATFNNNIIKITQSTPVAAEVRVTYYQEGDKKEDSLNKPFRIFDKNAIIWDKTEKLSAFITKLDPPIMEARGYIDMADENIREILPEKIFNAMQLFDLMGLYGIQYMTDPSGGYSQNKGKTNIVDSVMYPRDYLLQKKGDCDDCVTLYSSLIESVGISAALIDVPGHIFMMIGADIKENELSKLMLPEKMFVKWNGSLWIPIETTMFGKKFYDAWEAGLQQYQKYANNMKIIEVANAWKTYEPVTLEEPNWHFKFEKPDLLKAQVVEELDKFTKLRMSMVEERIGEILRLVESNPKDAKLRNKLGIIYGKAKLYHNAEKEFKTIIKINPSYPSAYNNLGNVYFSMGKYRDAIAAYNMVVLLGNESATVHYQLAKLYKLIGENDKEEDEMKIALEKDKSGGAAVSKSKLIEGGEVREYEWKE